MWDLYHGTGNIGRGARNTGLETWDLSKGPDSFERRRPGNAQGFLSAAGPEYFVATYAQKNYSVPQAQNLFQRRRPGGFPSAAGPGKFLAPQAREIFQRRRPGKIFSATGPGKVYAPQPQKFFFAPQAQEFL